MSEAEFLAANRTEPFETKLFKRRWWLMGCIGAQNLLLNVLYLYFGLNNDVFVSYFNLSYAVIDWFAVITRPGVWLTCVGFAMLSVMNKNSFRKISIAIASLTVAASICQLIAYAFPFLYWFMFVGNFLLGSAVAFVYVMPMSFAVLWFPDNEIGSALSFPIVIARIGFLLAFSIPSHFLTPPLLHDNNAYNVTANHSIAQRKQNWIDKEKQKLLIYIGIILISSVTLLVLLIAFAMDQPPKPPTIAQARLRQQVLEQHKVQFLQTLKEFFTEIKFLFTDFTFLSLSALLGFAVTYNFYPVLFVSEIVRPIFRSIYSNADHISSYLVVSFELGAISSTFVTGKLVDHVKNYLLLLRVYFFYCVISWIGFMIGYYFRSVPTIFASMIFAGVGCGLIFTPIFELSTQHTYPRNPQFIGSCLFAGSNIAFLIEIEINRLIIDSLGELSSLIYMAVLFCISLGLTVIVKPKYRRLEVEKNGVLSESEPLLNDDSGCCED